MVEQPDQMVELVTISSAPLDECCGVESNPEIIKLEEGVVQVQPPDLDPDPNIVDWDGPDDPMNPINWTPRQKYTALTTVTLIVFLTTATATMFAPSLPNVMKGYSSSSKELSYFVLSVYSLGRALGPLSIAPLSELYGRQPMYHMCNVLFLISVLACAAAPSLPALVAFRFISGVAGGGPVSLGTGTLADMVPQEKRGKAMGWWAIAPMVSSIIGPVAGGYITEAKGWRWNFWVMAIASGLVTIQTFCFVRESYSPTLLERKAKRLRKATGNPNLRSILASPMSSKEYFIFSIARPLKLLFWSPIVFLLSIYTAIVFGYTYIVFCTLASTFQEQYRFSQGSSGLPFLGMSIGTIIGLAISGLTSDRLLADLSKRNSHRLDDLSAGGGEKKPEYRLPIMIPGSLLIPASLFWYGWSLELRSHYLSPIFALGVFGVGTSLVFVTVSLYLIDAYTTHSASATAANLVLRSLLGSVIPLFGPKMFDSIGEGWGNSVLGFVSVAMVPLPVLFYIYGERIRKNCKTKF